MKELPQLKAKYDRFDMCDPDDIKRLEKVNNSILQDGWLLAREEWVRTKDGGTFVIVKYMESKKVKKKKDTSEPTNNSDGSKSEKEKRKRYVNENDSMLQ